MAGVTDIYFRSDLSLDGIATRLGLSDVTHDATPDEFVMGFLSGVVVDISRTDTQPPDIRICRVVRKLRSKEHLFSKELLDELTTGLRTFISGPIRFERWPALSTEED
jgi:hypothetical protein